jgi:hypothetical protein
LPRDVERLQSNRSTPDQRTGKPARGRGRLWAIGLLLAALGGWFALPPLSGDQPVDRQLAGTERLSTKAIELVRPGERTKGINPDASDRTAGLGDLDPATCRLVTLQQREEGVVVFRGSTIRPSAELDELGARPGANVDLALAEFGCEGPVEVAADEPLAE